MNFKKILACTLLGVTMVTSINVATTYAAGKSPARELGQKYGVDVTWDSNLERIKIAGNYYSIDELCDEVVKGTCMISDRNFHNVLHDDRISHTCPWDR
ncbi:hypothetical protein U732_4138 [Clostridium argentinense CDC 2741]|uniref:Uncharacterized protein n=1 Tax=Clostridium argentinense CDC 2741 TaxID=1418104 RepID=A0A0C1UM82_9CLOT|nr:hypothetical protein [Clostridium argentinense]ARC84956.1 hypothetical protein RSJ17_10740 [Clostridium argentinense]KIE48340.1 hypothetical protein U732_4138 [Clostridium argentinense CDC 2741]NFF41570.1 hypothetical protein [Clostridium argentinense]NFP52513.1 hypothetical protein [Clostridium argentinense]NFP74857.1 hypothetical protein [Clostridium argentinense]